MRGVELCMPADVNLAEMYWFVAPRPTLAERLLANPVALKKFCAEQQRLADAVYRPKAGTFDSYSVQFEAKPKRVPAFPELGGVLSGVSE